MSNTNDTIATVEAMTPAQRVSEYRALLKAGRHKVTGIANSKRALGGVLIQVRDGSVAQAVEVTVDGDKISVSALDEVDYSEDARSTAYSVFYKALGFTRQQAHKFTTLAERTLQVDESPVDMGKVSDAVFDGVTDDVPADTLVEVVGAIVEAGDKVTRRRVTTGCREAMGKEAPKGGGKGATDKFTKAANDTTIALAAWLAGDDGAPSKIQREQLSILSAKIIALGIAPDKETLGVYGLKVTVK